MGFLASIILATQLYILAMPPDVLPFDCYGISGRIYRYNTAGTELPIHRHKKSDEHICIVLSGSVLIRADAESFTLSPGQILHISEGVDHGILSLEDNTEVLHLLKYPEVNLSAGPVGSLVLSFESIRNSHNVQSTNSL